ATSSGSAIGRALCRGLAPARVARCLPVGTSSLLTTKPPMHYQRTLAFVLGASTALITAQAQQTPSSPASANESSDEIVKLEAFEVTELRSFSDQAIPGETPVSFTELGKEIISAE